MANLGQSVTRSFSKINESNSPEDDPNHQPRTQGLLKFFRVEIETLAKPDEGGFPRGKT